MADKIARYAEAFGWRMEQGASLTVTAPREVLRSHLRVPIEDSDFLDVL
jgi:hypothetical protein